jgi:hypothetical protein
MKGSRVVHLYKEKSPHTNEATNKGEFNQLDRACIRARCRSWGTDMEPGHELFQRRELRYRDELQDALVLRQQASTCRGVPSDSDDAADQSTVSYVRASTSAGVEERKAGTREGRKLPHSLAPTESLT